MPFAYPKKKCKNPNCPNGHFIPKRQDQLFCPGCKDNYHNNNRREASAIFQKREKQLRHNAKRLEYLYTCGLYPNGIPDIIIKHEKIDLQLYTHRNQNATSGATVSWSHNYGIEKIADTPSKLYCIHQRKK
jgi:hypothetical protein